MKVLFVNPACLDKRVTDDDAGQVPIGLYYLAAQLLDNGIFASILNLAGPQGRQPDALDLFLTALEEYQPDIIGFSVTTPSRINAQDCAGAARKRLPRALIVFGGPAPTFMADHLFKACPELDVIVRGEGEQSFLALAAALQGGRDTGVDAIPGLIFRRGKDLVDTGLAPPIADLDRLAHPSKYFTFQHLAMSRGCPGRCTFCGSPKFWGSGSVRRHSPDWFFEEIRTLAGKGVSHFFISDDTFTTDPTAVAAFCEKLIKARLNITWNAISRVDYIDESILSLMRRAGCIQISFGVESGSDKIKKILGKPMDDESSVRAFELVKTYGILPRAYFIYGSPGETAATIRDSMALMERLGPLSTVFYMLVVFPGTRLYTRARDKGWVDERVWFKQIEDLPWFELDPDMDFAMVKSWGDRLRTTFFQGLDTFVSDINLKNDTTLFPFHADFLSRLGMTFAQGEYSNDPRIKQPEKIAQSLFEKALAYHPDARAFLGLAMGLQKSRRFPEALTLLEAGLTQFPKHKELSVCMGVCLMNTGQFHRALSFFTPFDNAPELRHYINICKTSINA